MTLVNPSSEKTPLLENINPKNTNEPTDKHNIIYFLFMLQGLGMVLPWNIFITANEYFKNKFQNDENSLETFENAFSVGSQVPTTIFIFINLYLTGRVSRGLRIITSLVIATVCFVITTLLVNVNTETWTKKFFLLTILTIVLINACSGIYQGTILGIAGAVGGRYIQGTMVGLALGGVTASIASFISLAASSDVYSSAVGYFSMASLVLVVCSFAYIALMRSCFVKYYLEGPNKNEQKEDRPCESYLTTSEDSRSQISYWSTKTQHSAKSVWQVFKQIYPLALSACITFTIQLTLMPAVISGIKSTSKSSSKWNTQFFSTLVCFLLFNTGDMIGRIVAGMIQIVGSKGCKLPILCLLRIVFIPLFMFCNYQPRHHSQVYFTHDVLPIIFTSLFGFTNGYLGTLCMMYGPQLVDKPYMETAGVIMQLFLCIGLALGSGLSYPMVSLI